jgi:hypothetical protein
MADAPIRLVTEGYRPVPDDVLTEAEGMIADLRSGKLTGFLLVAVGPETAGQRVGYTGGRMDRMHLLGNLMMAMRLIEDKEMES